MDRKQIQVQTAKLASALKFVNICQQLSAVKHRKMYSDIPDLLRAGLDGVVGGST